MSTHHSQPIDKQQNTKRHFAADTSVFVSANAGSGKTSLLTGRVLALLLSGVAPSKILCLTFTNAAAAEMQSRVTNTLAKWVMMEEGGLKASLSKLTNAPLTKDLLAHARSLFATVLEAPVGIRLQTIHGFCQSLLARFPLEAGIGTHVSVVDGATQAALMQEARMQLFSSSKREGIHALVQQIGEYSLLSLLSEATHHQPLPTAPRIYQAFGANPEWSFPYFIEQIPRDGAHLARLLVIADVLASTKSAINGKTARILAAWASATDITEDTLLAYSQAFVDVEKDQNRKLCTQGVLTPEQEALLFAEAAIMVPLTEQFYAWRDARFTSDLLGVAATLRSHYDRLKNFHGVVDFDDQISAALHLLAGSNMSAWVMFKLDGGIDHVLVDEAQDTSHEQWQIVRALTAEFFAGKGRSEVERSLFVVGDEKQSIFRFQGADPAGLAANRAYFSQALAAAAMPYMNVALTHNYRSAPEILSLVDEVFSCTRARDGLTTSAEAITHQAKRDVQGRCEFWPLAEADEVRSMGSETVLANQVADQVTAWMGQGVKAGDVMVLVRRRTGFVYSLSRALKRRGVPVSGVDRMSLKDNLAVQDLLAFAQILLFPEDDLTLAALLKSPLFNMSEELLFELCHDRKTSLWQVISEREDCAEIHALLAEYRGKVDYISPFALFTELLDARGFRRSFVGRMGSETDEVLDIFLEQLLQFESGNTPSMQGFLRQMAASDSEIKRDMEQSGHAVRIMTVHASKGLQARIVIVADTVSVPVMKERIMLVDGVPMASSDASAASIQFRQARAKEKVLAMEEYRRLLYVALTRAEDVLIVCGAKMHNRKLGCDEESWYMLVQDAFKTIGREEGGRWIIGRHPVAGRDTAMSICESKDSFPLLGAAPLETTPPKSLSPSTLDAGAPPAQSPLLDVAAVERGQAMHRILQYAPQILDSQVRAKLAHTLAKTHAPHLSDEAQMQLVTEALAVMDHPEYAPLFSRDSLAEVPISGVVTWKGERVSVVGQMDRLVVREDEVWIVDYKSNARPSASIPANYQLQLALYAALLAEIYPTHRIRAWLLWTAIPRLDEVL